MSPRGSTPLVPCCSSPESHSSLQEECGPPNHALSPLWRGLLFHITVTHDASVKLHKKTTHKYNAIWARPASSRRS
uniref:Uncharacterized protein n=1 Tax=Arundo donax TaxID=35708 RepID=A0A0A8YLR3_ARUDO